MTQIPGAEAPVVVTGAVHAAEACRQLRDLGVRATILTEPGGRDSAPALLAASLWIARSAPDALAVVVASDHHIPDGAAFSHGVEAAIAAATAGAIVTFGVKPTYPATGFGYVRPGRALEGGDAVMEVEQFVEKPDRATAERLIAAGCLWNSGNFMFRADMMVAEARAHAPELLEAVRRALPPAEAIDGVAALTGDFLVAEKVSIDVAVMERTSRAAVLPIDYAWSDLGSWDAIWEASARDAAGNALLGDTSLTDSRDCLVRAEDGARVVVLGLRNVAVVARGKEVLVSDLASAARIRSALIDKGRALESPPPSTCADGLDGWALRLRDWLMRHALPTWWCFGADHIGGGFHEALAPDLTPAPLPRRARVQARQVFVYATAGRLGWTGPWRAAVRHGLAALETRFRRPDGLYRSVDPFAADDALLYDQAFVLLALSAAAGADGETAIQAAIRARQLASDIRRAFAHSCGGFSADTAKSRFLADPLMHLFEAALAWAEIDPEPLWRGLAGEIADLFSARLVDHGGARIFETYDPQWRPLAEPGEDRLEPGHHFEWAWLLQRWAALGGRAAGDDLARRLYDTGKAGIAPGSGLVLDALHDDLSVARATSRLWPQTERLRAALSLEEDPQARAREACDAARAMALYLTPSSPGLWLDAPPGPQVARLAPSPASSFYHIVGAIAALEAAVSEPRVGR